MSEKVPQRGGGIFSGQRRRRRSGQRGRQLGHIKRLQVFFFQAEDGIRDYKVTGVQTCALPILSISRGTDTPYRPRRRPCGARKAPRSISRCCDARWIVEALLVAVDLPHHLDREQRDRKSTRLNSSHLVISYAVFCLKKKKTTQQ